MIKKLLIFIIKLYQKTLSKGTCKFFPTCSEYMLEAIYKRGVFVGIFLGLCRILRCNHFSKGGIDKVPDKKNVIKWVL